MEYFHVVFTLAAEHRPYSLTGTRRLVYGLLFPRPPQDRLATISCLIKAPWRKDRYDKHAAHMGAAMVHHLNVPHDRVPGVGA